MKRTRELLSMLVAIAAGAFCIIAWIWVWVTLLGTTFWVFAPVFGIPLIIGISAAIYLDLREKSS